MQVTTFSILSQLPPKPSVGIWVNGCHSHESIQGSSYYLLHPNIPSTLLSCLLICGISKYLRCYDEARLSYATKFAIL